MCKDGGFDQIKLERPGTFGEVLRDIQMFFDLIGVVYVMYIVDVLALGK